MICPNCGKEIADTSKFCIQCGSRLEESPPAAPADSPSPAASAAPEGEGQTKKKHHKLIPVIAVVAAIAAGGIFAAVKLLNRKSSNQYAYFTNGKYAVTDDIEGDSTVQLSSNKSSVSAREEMVYFSPDGKYLYYFTKIDSNAMTGSLCRAEIGMLKPESDRNEKYIETIAANVQLWINMLDDGTLLYQNSDNKLFYYDGKNGEVLGKDVREYYTDGKKRVAYMSGDYDEGYTIYGISLDNIQGSSRNRVFRALSLIGSAPGSLIF